MAQGDVTCNISKPSGKGLRYNGIAGRVSIGSSTLLNMTSELTIMGWYNPTDNTDERHMIRKDTQYVLMQKNTNKLQAYLNDGGWIGPFNSSVSYAVKTWTHWALVVRRISATKVNVAFYKNGVIDDLGEQACGSFNTSGNVLSLGANGVANFYKGTQDNTKIFNTALSSADILLDYQKKMDTQNSLQKLLNKGLVAWYTFNDSSAPGHDDSGNGHNGTVMAGATSGGGHDTTEDDVTSARVTASDIYNFIPLANGRQIMTVHIEEA